ncbi:MAG: Fur family transcriptional regulator [Thermodesulfobacteriota bacterium]|jgi:Fe2+ or Zn2+ uptake regulation protein
MAAAQVEEQLAAELADHGLRATRQRVAILGLLRRSTTHPTAIDLHRRVLQEHPNISRKTVYEVLDSLVAAGLAARVTDAGEPARYEPRSDQHYHAHCRVCGRLYDLPAAADGPIRGRTALPEGFAVEHINVTFRGRCARCRENV